MPSTPTHPTIIRVDDEHGSDYNHFFITTMNYSPAIALIDDVIADVKKRDNQFTWDDITRALADYGIHPADIHVASETV